MKKSFILHVDSLSVLDDLSDEQAGKLFKAIFAYQKECEVELDFGLKMAFIPFKNQFVRDREKYETFINSQREKGKKSVVSRKSSRAQPLSAEPNQTMTRSTESTYSVSVSDNINIIVSFLNSVTGTHYKPKSLNTRKFIEARLRENFSVEDFKKVITKKFKDWGADEKMKIYLRPETLFGNKFESYLQETSLTELPKKGTVLQGWL